MDPCPVTHGMSRTPIRPTTGLPRVLDPPRAYRATRHRTSRCRVRFGRTGSVACLRSGVPDSGSSNALLRVRCGPWLVLPMVVGRTELQLRTLTLTRLTDGRERG